MVAPLRVELSPPGFQTGARSRYAREPQNLERSTGLESVLEEWHSSVLAATLTPLNQKNMDRKTGLEPVSELLLLLIQSQAGYLLPPTSEKTYGWPSWIRTRHSTFRELRDTASLTANTSKLAPRAGFEPAVGALTVRCLTAWLPRNIEIQTQKTPAPCKGRGPENSRFVLLSTLNP